MKVNNGVIFGSKAGWESSYNPSTGKLWSNGGIITLGT